MKLCHEFYENNLRGWPPGEAATVGEHGASLIALDAIARGVL